MCASPTRASASARRRRGTSYLNMPAILSAATITGADAIHPGLGFLSENADFAEVVEEHGFTFIGPYARAYPADGRQGRAPRRRRSELGIPTVPGSADAVATVAAASEAARAIGYPVLLKAAAGGGGRGMKLAHDEAELAEAAAARPGRGEGRVRRRLGLPRALSRAAAPYRDPAHRRRRGRGHPSRRARLLAAALAPEAPRGDALARRSTPAARERLRRIAVDGDATSSATASAGTIEFLYQDGEFYLHRDEHAAAGRAPDQRDDQRHRPRARAVPHRRRRALGYRQGDIQLRGHAIECRINAENPDDFRPSPGRISEYHAPGGLGHPRR